ncbi:MAG TPA: BRO family protein [bacterium]|nr:BRO family protein [bacterium]
MDAKSLSFFNGAKIRRVWDEKEQKWYFSVVDVVGVLTESDRARKYWSDLKVKLIKEGAQLSEKIGQLKFMSLDGKYYVGDAADVETIFRLIQSIPSKNAEPFKLWLAKVGRERLEEMADPEKAIIRSQEYWRKMGRSEKWIKRRLVGQEIRNKLTEYWRTHDVDESKDFALLSNIIHKGWSDLTITEHKNLKNLDKQNLRDHMSDVELFFTSFAELATEQIAESLDAKGLAENKIPAKKGGAIAKDARLKLEAETGKPVVDNKNFLNDSANKKLI